MKRKDCGQERRSSRLLAFLLGGLVAAQILFMGYWGTQKEGYHVDEIYTYGLSNSYYLPFLDSAENFENHWLTPDDFSKYVKTQDGTRFKYDSVYYNQEKDVHPPLYYFLIHTIASLLPGTFSKWVGIGLNILFFAISIVLVYCICLQITKRRWLSMLPCIFWGFSAGAISSVVFIRMYAMLTCLTLLITWLTFRLLDSDNISLKQMAALSTVALIGFLTQYYFVVYLFFLFVGTALFLFLQKRFRDFWKYTGSLALGGVLGILFFPASLSHIFFGYRGKENQSNLLLLGNWKSRIRSYVTIVNDSLFGSFLKAFVLLFIGLLLLAGIKALVARSQVRSNDQQEGIFSKIAALFRNPSLSKFFILGFTSLFYFLLISKISSYEIDRYMFPVFPQIGVLAMVSISSMILFTCKDPRFAGAISLAICIALCPAGILRGNISYLYPGAQEADQIAVSHSAELCVVVSDYPNRIHENFTAFSQYRGVYFTRPENLSLLSQGLAEQGESSSFVLYVDTSLDQSSILQQIKSSAHLTNSQEISSFNIFTGYYIA